MCGVFLSTMDSGMVNVALPTAMRELSLALPQAELIVTVYLITITVTLVLWGQFADRVGRCNVYLAGMAFFSVSSLCCYLTPTLYSLLFFRFLQAMGAAMMMSSGPAIIKTVFGREKLGRSLGLIGIATASGLLTGPFVSGLLLSKFGWKSIFLVTLPVSLTALVLGTLFLRAIFPPVTIDSERTFDWRGSCYWILATVSGMWLIHSLNEGVSFYLLLNALLLSSLIVLFIKTERQVKYPILPIHLLKKRFFWIAVCTAALSFSGLFSVLILLPFYLDYLRGFTSLEIGRIMMAVPATLMLLSPLAGYLYDKVGARFLTASGLLVSSLALFGLSQVYSSTPVPQILLLLAALGAGQSIFLSPNSASVLSRVSDEYTGVSAGILATARNFGMVAGATCSVLIFSLWYGAIGNGHTVELHSAFQEAEFLTALQGTFMLTALLPLSGSCLSLFRGGKIL